MSESVMKGQRAVSDRKAMLDQSHNLGSSPSCPTTKLYDLGQKSMVSAFSVVCPKVVV